MFIGETAKIAIDFDMKINTESGEKFDINNKKDIVNELCNFCEFYFKYFNINNKFAHYIILDACTQKKYSFHIHFPKIVYECISDFKIDLPDFYK